MIFFRRLVFLLIAVLVGSQSAFAESLLEIDRGALAIALDSSSSGKTGYFLTISDNSKGKNSITKVEAFTVNSPARVVVDVFGFPSKSPFSREVKDSLVTSFRLGVHPDKTIIVIDLREDREPKVAVRRINNNQSIIVLFGYGDKEGTKESSSTSTTTSLTTTTSPTYTSPTDTVPFEESTTPPLEVDNPGETNSSTTTTTQPQEALPLPTENEVQGNLRPPENEEVRIPSGSAAVVYQINFQLAGNNSSPAVVIGTKNLGNFTVTKKRSSLYELLIEKATLAGDNLRLTQFPPESFRGLEAVIAHSRGDDVVVKIYVEDNVKLFPYRSGDQVWVKVAD